MPKLLIFILNIIFFLNFLSCSKSLIKKDTFHSEGDSLIFVIQDSLQNRVDSTEELEDDQDHIYIISENFEDNFLYLKNTYNLIKKLNTKREFKSAYLLEKIFFKIYNSLKTDSLFNSQSSEFKEDFILNNLYECFLDEYNYTLQHLDNIPEDLMLYDIIKVFLENENILDSAKLIPPNLKSQEYSIPVEINKEVLYSIRFFTGKGRKIFENWYKRMGIYENIIYSILDQFDLPHDLIYIAMIESGFKTSAVSNKKAVGLWQFIAPTARLYGLKINYWIDERKDYVKSTFAAARYYKDLYATYKDWFLAFASYNWGGYRVKSLLKRRKTHNFWDIYYFLPKETRLYVTSFIAVSIISKNLDFYGFKDLEKYPPIEYRTVNVAGGLLLSYLAECADTTEEVIKFYNPEIKIGCTPGNEDEYILKIPAVKYNTFLKNYKALPKKEKVLFVKHVIRKGDSIYKLSKIYKVPQNQIISANNLDKNSILRIGQTLIIPLPVSALSN